MYQNTDWKKCLKFGILILIDCEVEETSASFDLGSWSICWNICDFKPLLYGFFNGSVGDKAMQVLLMFAPFYRRLSYNDDEHSNFVFSIYLRPLGCITLTLSNVFAIGWFSLMIF